MPRCILNGPISLVFMKVDDYTHMAFPSLRRQEQYFYGPFQPVIILERGPLPFDCKMNTQSRAQQTQFFF